MNSSIETGNGKRIKQKEVASEKTEKSSMQGVEIGDTVFIHDREYIVGMIIGNGEFCALYEKTAAGVDTKKNIVMDMKTVLESKEEYRKWVMAKVEGTKEEIHKKLGRIMEEPVDPKLLNEQTKLFYWPLNGDLQKLYSPKNPRHHVKFGHKYYDESGNYLDFVPMGKMQGYFEKLWELEELPNKFVIKSSSDPKKTYKCQVLGINILSDGIILKGKDSRGNIIFKEVKDLKALKELMVVEKE